MSIAEFCNRDVVCATRDTTILEAASLMRRHHVGDIIIVDEDAERRWPIGIVTDRDIVVEVVAAGLDPGLVKLADLMLEPLTILEQHEGVAQTVRTMAQKGVRRMPVVDAQGALLGIVTLDDLLAHFAPPLADLGELVRQSRQREMQKRKSTLA
jgi:CBS domain-containing protein